MDVLRAPIAKSRDACSNPNKGMMRSGKAVAQLLLTAQESAISFALPCRSFCHHAQSLAINPLSAVIRTAVLVRSRRSQAIFRIPTELPGALRILTSNISSAGEVTTLLLPSRFEQTETGGLQGRR